MGLHPCDIDIKMGYFIIPHPKEKKPKLVPIIEEDIKILSAMPKGLPTLYFFRHKEGVKGAKAGEKFGEKYLSRQSKVLSL